MIGRIHILFEFLISSEVQWNGTGVEKKMVEVCLARVDFHFCKESYH